MTQFLITPAPTAQLAALITATGYERPDEYLHEVATALRERGISGDIVLDLLAANGSMRRRFFLMPFEAGKFAAHRFSLLQPPAPDLVSAADAVIRLHARVMDLGLLPPGARAQVLLGATPEQMSACTGCSSAGLVALARA